MRERSVICFVLCMTVSFFVRAESNIKISDNDVAGDMVVMSRAKIRVLNKQLGRVNTSTLDVGDSYQLDNLKIIVYACYKSKEYDTPENTMFIKVQYMDTHNYEIDKDNVTIFSGWMFSSSPSLSAMEHSIYDIWLLSCEK